IVIFGGIKVISNVCERLVPFMSIFYVIGCIIIICMNGHYFGQALALICTCAFTPRAAFGGAAGTTVWLALQMGCARGLFSNESGMGSAPLVAASATTRNPARQALVSMTGTFWDTVVVCALTGLALVTGILGNPDIAGTFVAGGFAKNAAALTTSVFAEIPVVGPIILCVGLVCFTYSTILGWSYYGNRCITYLFGKHAIRPYQVIYVIVAFLGAIGVSGFVWNISDITNALMALPNIVAVLGLSGVIWAGTKHYVYDKNLMERDETELPVVMTK
ncbi:MAG: alanine/glycine:cation symporter family protein, partial [Coriobacteriales bacterium]